MPMNNDPVLSRPMFSNSLTPTVQPFQAKGTGITSNVVSPDEGAKQLINTFGGSGMAGLSGASYAAGGYVKHFKDGGYNDEPPVPDINAERESFKSGISNVYQRLFNPTQEQQDEAARQLSEKQRQMTAAGISAEEAARVAPIPEDTEENRAKRISDLVMRGGANQTDEGEMQSKMPDVGIRSIDRSAGSSSAPTGDSYNEEIAGVNRSVPTPEPTKRGEEQGPPMPSKAGEREKRAGKGGLDLLLEDIKNRRAASAEEKENNKWMALMQAGLAIAGGRSPHALQNVGAGGLQGAQAYAASEKDRRAEDRSLFSEEAQVRLAQEKMAESADERAAQREMLAAKEKERLHERALTRESQSHDRGIAQLTAITGQARQELRDIATSSESIDRDIIKIKTTMGIDPAEAKATIEQLERRKQDLNDRYREVIERQDALLGRQGQKVPDRGPPSLSLPNGETIRYSGFTAK